MSPDEKLRLTHIAEAAALIADYLKGVSKEAFLNDRLRQDAAIRTYRQSREWSRTVCKHVLIPTDAFVSKTLLEIELFRRVAALPLQSLIGETEKGH